MTSLGLTLLENKNFILEVYIHHFIVHSCAFQIQSILSR